MRVSNEPESISDILKDKTFKVPLYQREYSWSLEQVSDLFYDIHDSDKDARHFLGSLLLYKENTNDMEIVDGQQRLTTLFLLLFTILECLRDKESHTNAVAAISSLIFVKDPYDLSNDNLYSEPRLETGKRDRYLFKSIIKNEDYSVHKDGRKRSHKNLTNTLDFFINRIDEIKESEGLNGVMKYAEKVIKSQFIVMTAEKKSDKLLLFKTINARGLELTQGDLIKNELCHNLGNYDIDEAIDYWDEIRTRIEKNNGNLDLFLFHYLNSRDDSQRLRQQLEVKRGLETTERKKYPPAPEKYVFELYSQIIQEEDSQKFLEELLQASDRYVTLVSPPSDKISLNSLKAMGVNKCFPLLLKAKKSLNETNFDLICNAIDALTFRHSILRKDPKELERFYYQLSENIVGNDSVKEVIEEIKNHQNFKDDNKFKSEFIIASPKASVSRMILDRIVRSQSESVNWSNRDVHIEHIMPQKPAGEWKVLFDKDENEYKDYLNRLGNLTILQDKKNIRARNKNFSDKKEHYKLSRLTITNELENYTGWGYNEILSRQEKLYDLSKDFWK